MEVDYQEFSLEPPLASHVRCVWELRGPKGDPEPQLIVPDGCMELVLNWADPFEQIDDDGQPHRQPAILVVGEVRRPVRTRPTGRIDLLGVRFSPGSAPFFLGTPGSQLIDRLSDQTAIATFSFRQAVQDTLVLPSPARRAALIEALHLALAQAGPKRDAVVAPVAELVAHEGLLDISRLEVLSNLKKRTLERRFLETVGCPPKALAQVLRFRRVLRSIEAHDVQWADTALECGYYDQAHLVRDFRRYTGLTPGQYLKADHPLTVLFDGVRPL